MPLSGKLAHYDIVAKVGEGGMGEVYKARDTRLGREVAIKVLPEAFANDEERMSRFEREARTLAALSHPNIAVLFGLEVADGVRALVMEYVAGSTLADRLSAGAIPLEESLAYARQMAEALEAAHEKGIVHRDLKPANVKVTPEGTLKVLDFGLAKALEPEAASGDPGLSPTTVTLGATRAGVILGTAGYMSPEQVRGRPADQRADIWAYGVVVYEMLTGRRMFEGETVSDSLAGVLRADIDFSKLPAETPPAVRKLLRRCLERDHRKRLRHIGDALAELDDISAEVAAARPAPEVKRRPLWWMIAAGVFFAAASALAVLHFTEAPPLAEAVRFQIDPPEGARLNYPPAVSPDGRSVAYTATVGGAGRLLIRPFDSLESRVLVTEDVALPFWSPDGAYIGYFSQGRLKKVAASGGPAETIAATGQVRGGTWGAKGVIVYAATSGQLFQVAATGGDPKPLLAAERGTTVHGWPHFLPGGERFLVLSVTGSSMPDASGELRIAGLDGSPSRRVVVARSRAEFAMGHILFQREDSLMAQRFDPERLEVTGDPFRVADGAAFVASSRRADFSASPGGAIAFRTGVTSFNEFQWYDRTGKPLDLLTPNESGNQSHPDIAPDGSRVAVDRGADLGSRDGAGRDIWVVDIERKTSSRLTAGGGNWVSVWSPDSRRIAYTCTRKGIAEICVADASGTGEVQLLLADGQPKHHLAWSPDGKLMVYEQGGAANYDLWVLPLDGKEKPYALLSTEFFEGQPRFSPDGKWLGYISNRTGRFEVYVDGFGGSNRGRWQISTAGGIQPRWRKDGRELCYLAADGNIMSVPIETVAGALKAGSPKALFRTSQLGTAASMHVDMTPDAQRFLLHRQADSGQPESITVVLNWLAGRK